MSDPIRKPDEFPSRSESILSDTIGLEGYSIETPPRSRIENLLIELKEIIDQGGGSSTAYATSLEITMDEYFVMSATLKNKDGDTLGQVQTVDLPLESVVVNGSYDSINKNVVLTLENGNSISFSVADLVSGLQTEITSNNKLDADLVNDTNSTHKFTTASDIYKLAGIEEQANKTTVDDALSDSSTNPVQNKVVKTALDSKADVSTTYTKTEVDTALAGKLGTDTHYAGSSTTGGSANSAAKLDNSTDAGSATQPVYFSSGVPTATTYSLAKSVPADAVFTDTTYESKAAASGGTDVSLVTTGDKYIWNNKQNTIDDNSKLSSDLVDDTNAAHKFVTTEQLSQITTNKNNILSIQQEQVVQNREISTLREITNCKLYGFKIDKQDVNPDTRVTYLYDAVGMTPAYMDFSGDTFNYGSWADIWFIKNNRPVALKFDGTVDYELSHTDFTKKIDGETASDVEDVNYAGNFMSEMPLVYVKRWEDERYNYTVFSETKPNDDYLAQAHTNANGTVNPYIYLPMFKGYKDGNGKLRSLMGTTPWNTTGGASNEVTAASACGDGWQLWDKAKIDLVMDLIVLITKSTSCRAKIGNGVCNTGSDASALVKSGYETDGTTRSTNAQFFGTEGTDSSGYGQHHMCAFYIEDLWGNRWDRCLGFNLVSNVYKVKMVAPYLLVPDSTYQTLSVTPPSSTEGWLKNVSSGVWGDVPTEVGASNTSGFANYFYKRTSDNLLSLFGGSALSGLLVGRYWFLNVTPSGSYWYFGGSPCYNAL